MTTYRRLATFKTASQFLEYAATAGAELPFDHELEHGAGAPLAQSCEVAGVTVGNRFAILPMEGWDATPDGRPSDLTIRRWRRFGQSGAKLIWGGEAVAVRHDGRANPRQLLSTDDTIGDLARLRETLVAEHASRFSRTDDLLVGLQLTHSGRYARPGGPPEPMILYRHPFLDRKLGLPADYPLLGDDELSRLVEAFVAAARRAQQAGYAFVDVKHCHGYLGHELLSAVDRPGRYGGSFENRTRFLREIVAGIRSEAAGLEIAVRLSAVDCIPYRAGAERIGEPEAPPDGTYRYAFGGDGTGLGFDLREPKALLDLFAAIGIRMVCVSLGSPYYAPHLIRPAYFPPSDGYLPPEDPLVGVARHLAVTAELKRHRPEMIMVGSGYTYLQQWLPNVAQAVVRRGEADFVGLGRMVLSYPELPADVLAGGRCAGSNSVARSATAPRARATAWYRAAIRSTVFIRNGRKRPNSRK